MIPEAKILSFLEQHEDADAGLYVGERIPPKKLHNAVETFPVPSEEKVLGLLDCTVFGSNKNGLAICAEGLRWRNDWTTPTSRTAMTWEEFQKVALSAEEYAIVFAEDVKLNLAGGAFPKERLLGLLGELQELVRRETVRPERHAPGGSHQVGGGAEAAPGSSAWEKKRAWHFSPDGAKVVGPVPEDWLIARMVEERAAPDRCRLWNAELYRWEPLASHPKLRAALMEYHPLPAEPLGPPTD
jgi:hypothetical protein